MGDEIKKVNYKEGKWDIHLNENEAIVAWKEILPENIKNKEEWLFNHKEEIKNAFQLKTMDIRCFEIVETLVECICEYGEWIRSGHVQYIDGIYVVRVI